MLGSGILVAQPSMPICGVQASGISQSLPGSQGFLPVRCLEQALWIWQATGSGNLLPQAAQAVSTGVWEAAGGTEHVLAFLGARGIFRHNKHF